MIREANSIDLCNLMPVYEEYHQEGREEIRGSFELETLMTNAMLAKEHPDYLILVAYKGGKLVGFLHAYASPEIWNSDLILNITLLYVRKEHRGTCTALYLMRKAEQWGKKKGAVNALSGANSGIADKLVNGFYERLGFKPIGLMFNKKIGD